MNTENAHICRTLGMLAVVAVNCLLMNSACSDARDFDPVKRSERSEPSSEQLKVVHMAGDRDLLPGINLGQRIVITVITTDSQQYRFTSEAIPTSVFATIDSISMKRNAHADDRPVIAACNVLQNLPSQPHPICRDRREILIGEAAVIGGFSTQAIDCADAMEFFTHSPMSVDVRRCAAPANATPDDTAGHLWFTAPAADYRGFIGGPLACRDTDGRLTLIGIVLSQSPLSDPAEGTLLCAARIDVVLRVLAECK